MLTLPAPPNRRITLTLLAALLLAYQPHSAAQLPPMQESQLQSASPQGDRYVLGVGDRVQVYVYNVPDYTGEQQVLSDGTLNFAPLGTIYVQGMSLAEASQAIAAELTRFIRRPFVTLSLVEARPLRLLVSGEVNRPGSYTLPATSESGAPRLTQVLQLAGGITQSADIRRIQIRRSADPTVAGGQAIDVNLWQLLQMADPSQDIVLRDGDAIVIPTAIELDASEALAVAAASFSPDTITVNVVGEVNRPGAVQVPPNTPLNQALLAAGGFNNQAVEREVELIRLNPNGTVSKQTIEVELSQGLNAEINPALRNNDIIVVDRTTFSETMEVVEGVSRAFLSPLTGLLNLFRLF